MGSYWRLLSAWKSACRKAAQLYRDVYVGLWSNTYPRLDRLTPLYVAASVPSLVPGNPLFESQSPHIVSLSLIVIGDVYSCVREDDAPHPRSKMMKLCWKLGPHLSSLSFFLKDIYGISVPKFWYFLSIYLTLTLSTPLPAHSTTKRSSCEADTPPLIHEAAVQKMFSIDGWS